MAGETDRPSPKPTKNTKPQIYTFKTQQEHKKLNQARRPRSNSYLSTGHSLLENQTPGFLNGTSPLKKSTTELTFFRNLFSQLTNHLAPNNLWEPPNFILLAAAIMSPMPCLQETPCTTTARVMHPLLHQQQRIFRQVRHDDQAQ